MEMEGIGIKLDKYYFRNMHRISFKLVIEIRQKTRFKTEMIDIFTKQFFNAE